MCIVISSALKYVLSTLNLKIITTMHTKRNSHLIKWNPLNERPWLTRYNSNNKLLILTPTPPRAQLGYKKYTIRLIGLRRSYITERLYVIL